MTTTQQVYHRVKGHHNNFALLHCVSSYPTLPSDVNLNVLKTYQDEFPDVVIGYSGHEMGTVVSTAAVALGARVSCNSSITIACFFPIPEIDFEF